MIPRVCGEAPGVGVVSLLFLSRLQWFPISRKSRIRGLITRLYFPLLLRTLFAYHVEGSGAHLGFLLRCGGVGATTASLFHGSSAHHVENGFILSSSLRKGENSDINSRIPKTKLFCCCNNHHLLLVLSSNLKISALQMHNAFQDACYDRGSTFVERS